MVLFSRVDDMVSKGLALAQLEPPWGERVAWAMVIILGAGIVHTLIEFTQAFKPEDVKVPRGGQAAVLRVRPLSQLARWHILGEFRAKTLDPIDLSPTSLNLT